MPKWSLSVFAIFLCLSTLFYQVHADNLSSSHYKLVDPEIDSTAGTTQSTNYKVLIQGSNGISYGQISSSLYKLGSGQGYTFMANVPKITCFETATTSSTTTCLGLPDGNGMVGECGESGCYDRAKIEIDTQANPTDTLYEIEVSSDNWTTVYVVSGTTHIIKAASAKTIADYLTKAQWENSPWNKFNILGLQPGTAYKARIRALQGNFTETPPGPTITATTAAPTVTFDLDIGPTLATENNPPYTVAIGTIASGSYVFQNTQLINVDISTNAQNGASVYVRDQWTGLKDANSAYVLPSSSEDLSLVASGDGFGLQKVTATQANSSGYLVFGSTYNVTGTNVGAVTSSADTLVACSLTSSSSSCEIGTPTWVKDGRIQLKVGARASPNAKASAGYQDTLQFTVVGGW